MTTLYVLTTVEPRDGLQTFEPNFLVEFPNTAFSNFCYNMKFILLTSREEPQQKYYNICNMAEITVRKRQ